MGIESPVMNPLPVNPIGNDPTTSKSQEEKTQQIAQEIFDFFHQYLSSPVAKVTFGSLFSYLGGFTYPVLGTVGTLLLLSGLEEISSPVAKQALSEAELCDEAEALLENLRAQERSVQEQQTLSQKQQEKLPHLLQKLARDERFSKSSLLETIQKSSQENSPLSLETIEPFKKEIKTLLKEIQSTTLPNRLKGLGAEMITQALRIYGVMQGSVALSNRIS